MLFRSTYYSISSTQTNPLDTILDATTSHGIQTNPASTERSRHITRSPTKEISPKITIFSSPTSSVNIPNPLAPSTATTALETHQRSADFAQKVEKVENPSLYNEISPKFSGFSLPMSYLVAPNLPASSTTTPAPETSQIAAAFTQKLGKLEDRKSVV